MGEAPMWRELRTVATICPHCLVKLRGSLVRYADRVALRRECPRDGVTEKVLSWNPELYADWDRFYFNVLKRGEPRGRIVNNWVVCTAECQMQCSYCHADVQDRFPGEMSASELDRVLSERFDGKLTLSGGEPTLHPGLLHFFRRARELGRRTQLATNGIRLADRDLCARLREAGLVNVRLSCELLSGAAPAGEFSRWVATKRKALQNLEELGFRVTLSPTIFKGVNEGVLIEALDYAAAHPFIREISVNGFSWVGHGTVRNPDEMIMPDEMTDRVCAAYGVRDRGEIFTLQKAVFTFLQLMNVRACIYTQFLVFRRTGGRLEMVTDYLEMRRMRRALRRWERFGRAPRFLQIAAFACAMTAGLRPRSLRLLPDIIRIASGTLFKGDWAAFGGRLLPVVLNTNCSTLTMDEEVGRQCMSGVLIKRGDTLARSVSAIILMEKEIAKGARPREEMDKRCAPCTERRV
ncbi:MAG: radical SAM protein [Candidatus Aureabacteria bacterium]|nr:radical SAM protein [Candidatus Auribacterota bacterium]